MNARSLNTRVAVVGAGIAGLGAALALTDQGYEVTVFEASPQPGGHARTVDLELDGISFAVDTGFLVFNHRTYPRLLALFERLQVPTSPSDMSFAVSEGPHRFEWAGTNLRSVFAQPKNLFSIPFWRMLADIRKFNRDASALALRIGDHHDSPEWRESLASYLERNHYSATFRDHYLLPMAAAIWSCPMETMSDFPIGSFIRFFHNHGLLMVTNRPQWYTVTGGSREYVRRMLTRLADVRAAVAVHQVSRLVAQGVGAVAITSDVGVERFDHVILACHSNQALALLGDPSPAELSLLQGVRYQANEAWLHTDVELMPQRRRAWAAWNYLSDGNLAAPSVSVTYWLNKLQPLPCKTPLLLSLNPLRPPAPSRVISRFEFEHPILNAESAQAVRELPRLQGQRNTWFAGAWLGFGFHEDGLRSGQQAASALIASLQAGDQTSGRIPDRSSDLLSGYGRAA